MKYFFLISLFFISVSGSASTFEVLQELYKNAQEANFQDLLGWHYGYCFRATEPERVWGGMITGDTFPSSPEMDPIRKIAILWSEDSSYYEKIDLIKNIQINEYLKSTYPNISEVSSSDGSLVSRNNGGIVEYQIRQTEKQFIGRLVAWKDTKTWKKGDIHSFCSFNR